MVLGVAYDFDAASVAGNSVALGDGVWRVVSAFGLHIGTNFLDYGSHVRLGKDYYRIHVGERGNDFCALVVGHDGAAFAFEAAHGIVGIYGDDQAASKGLSAAQISHVADMQQIEGAVGQNDSVAAATPGLGAVA